MAAACLKTGAEIDDHQVLSVLAKGGMGAIFQAIAPNGQRVALKTPLPHCTGYRRMRRFLREARLTRRMNHPDVVNAVSHGRDPVGLPYFTVELVDGTALSDLQVEEGVFEPRRAVALIEQAARALQHIHEQGVVHRDIKPGNVLVRPDGSVCLIDFGLARDMRGRVPAHTEKGMWVGTAAYISPEQAGGEACRVDPRADIYGLAAVLYELIAGFPPYGLGRPRAIFDQQRERDPRPLGAVQPDCPTVLETIVMKALSRDPNDRQHTALDFAEDLASFLRGSGRFAPLSISDLEASWVEECGTHTELTPVQDPGQEAPSLPEMLVPATPAPAPSAGLSAANLSDSARRKRKRLTSKRVGRVGSSSATRRRPRTRGLSRTTRRLAVESAQRNSALEALAFSGPLVAAAVGLALLLLI
jgi:serine/threonine protein kinase